MDPNRKKERATKENLDGGYDCRRVGGRSMDGQRGKAFGFRKATEDAMVPGTFPGGSSDRKTDSFSMPHM